MRKGRGSGEGKEEVAGVRHTFPAVLTDWTWKEMSEWVGGWQAHIGVGVGVSRTKPTAHATCWRNDSVGGLIETIQKFIPR